MKFSVSSNGYNLAPVVGSKQRNSVFYKADFQYLPGIGLEKYHSETLTFWKSFNHRAAKIIRHV